MAFSATSTQYVSKGTRKSFPARSALALALFLAVSGISPRVVDATPDWDLVDTALTVAERSIAAIGARAENLYEDIIIGLAMVIDQLALEIPRLERLLHKLKRRAEYAVSKDVGNVEEALERCRALLNVTLILYQRGLPMFRKKMKPEFFEILYPMLRPGSWSFHFPYCKTSVSLMELPFAMGAFEEYASDACIYELTRPRTPAECNITYDCFKLMTNPYTEGYWITHEVFYILIGYKSPCKEQLLSILAKQRSLSLRTFLRVTCSNVLRDSLNTERRGFPDTKQDLMIEQIGFCGLAGFAEFYRPEWIRNISSWQRPDGCFSFLKEDSRTDPSRVVNLATGVPGRHRRRKRTELYLRDGCRLHKTMLGAITMTTGLRFLMDGGEREEGGEEVSTPGEEDLRELVARRE